MPGRKKIHARIWPAVCLLLLLDLLPQHRTSTAMLHSAPAASVWQKGITYTHLYRPENNLLSRRSQDSLHYLKTRVGAEWIALNPFAYQHTYDDPHIYLEADPPDAHLRHAIQEAHRLGLKVMLKPHIWLRDRSNDKWRGAIEMADEERWGLWFSDYERFILHYAKLAADEQVELFCIGTELATTAIQRETDWRRLIARIRQHYSGSLVYAANWWAEYEHIAFWDALDYIGINAFFPLSDISNPSLAELRHSAAAIAENIGLLYQHTGKPVIFTEVGFKSVRGTSIRPWVWTRQHDVVDLDAQVRCYQAIFETFWSRPWFYGMYWWKWHSDLDRGGSQHTGFTPRRKPAEQVLTEWYNKPAPGH